MEKAVFDDLASYDKNQPGFNTLQQSALALAREIDDPTSTSAKAPLVKQMVTIVQLLLGEEAGDDGLEDLLSAAGSPPVLPGAQDWDAP